MIIGGAFQGKLAYGKEHFQGVEYVDGGACTLQELLDAKGIYRFHEFIKRQLKLGEDVSTLADRLWEQNEHTIIISDEVGYGIVPMDTFDRAYRETVGRVCTKLASHSKEVHRVVCGVGTVIKSGEDI